MRGAAISFTALVLLAMLGGCSKPVTDAVMNHCDQDSDCTGGAEELFLNPENARCRVRPDSNFRECSECESHADCPAGAQCLNRTVCRIPDRPDMGSTDADNHDGVRGDAATQ